jgi:hypothetical protein
MGLIQLAMWLPSQLMDCEPFFSPFNGSDDSE